ncbi:MAG: YgjV family protein [Clostridia bacterium]|nr:YgjV family protein [Clostridia bacterium]
MNINWLEWLGYLASVTVLVSLLMSSVKRLRWINLAGSLFFSVYGFLIGSLPVGFMNAGIVVINIYYLNQIYRSKEYFKILPIEGSSSYLKYFMDHYAIEIDKLYPDYDISNPAISFFVLRNTVPAGIFICSDAGDGVLNIELDYVTPQYRDFRVGTYIFEHEAKSFLEKGYSSLVCRTDNKAHVKYLRKMGFVKDGDGVFVKGV